MARPHDCTAGLGVCLGPAADKNTSRVMDEQNTWLCRRPVPCSFEVCSCALAGKHRCSPRHCAKPTTLGHDCLPLLQCCVLRQSHWRTTVMNVWCTPRILHGGITARTCIRAGGWDGWAAVAPGPPPTRGMRRTGSGGRRRGSRAACSPTRGSSQSGGRRPESAWRAGGERYRAQQTDSRDGEGAGGGAATTEGSPTLWCR